MECFPLILLRVAGLPQNTLLPLRWTAWEVTDQLLDYPARQTSRRSAILEEIKTLHDQLTDPFLQKRLSYLRADFQQGDRVRIDKFETFFPDHPALIESLKTYLQFKEAHQQQLQEFEALYAQKLLADREALQALSASPQLQNGLLFSSASLIDRIRSFQQCPAAAFRKKERQTQQTVLQYLSRIVFKTSPFSSFCGLALKDLNRVGEKPGQKDRLLQLNNYLLAHLQERLEETPAFYRQLHIRRNSGIQQQETSYAFLLNSRNAESVQILERDELLDLIFDLTNSSCIFTQMLISLQDQINSSLQEIEEWLIGLVKVGFLEWQWPFSILSLDADRQLFRLLQQHSDDQALKTLGQQLEQLIQWKDEFSTAAFPQRKKLLDQAAGLLAEMKSAMPAGEEPPSADHFHKFGSHPLALSREKIFYEDVRLTASFEIGKDELTPFAATLHKLATLIHPIQYSRINDQIQDCFTTHFADQQTVGLLDFYQAYHRYQPPATSPQKTAIEALREQWKAQLSNQFQLNSNGELHLKLAQLATLPKGTIPATTQWATSNAALLQFDKQGDQWLAYTDACITGYGKHFARFLTLFSPEYTELIRESNRSTDPNILHLELCDNSFFNANQHPSLCDYELSLSGSRNQLPKKQQIPITDIAIHQPQPDTPLQVLHLPTGQQILPFDLGVEALQSRSPMYRLLAAFSPATPAISEFKVLLNDLYGLHENDLIIFPRIILEDQLLLQRKHWYIPAAQLPLPQPGEQDAAYFLRIQQWHRQHFPSPQLFLTLQPKNITFEGQAPAATAKGDDYKPQYFDLSSPAFVRLLGSKLKGRDGVVKVEERWPTGEEVERKCATEILITF